MNLKIVLRLKTDSEQLACLERLQAAFAEVCTAIGPIVQVTRCWNRVALHHLAYRKLREQFPALGSQMVCNAIYSVSRSARLIFQNRASPWSLEKRQDQPLPLMRFAASAPVYFDRHTLSLRRGKLKEIQLSRDVQGFFLVFSLGTSDEAIPEVSELPEYLMILEPAVLAA